jgi:hypothetical protein
MCAQLIGGRTCRSTGVITHGAASCCGSNLPDRGFGGSPLLSAGGRGGGRRALAVDLAGDQGEQEHNHHDEDDHLDQPTNHAVIVFATAT